MKKHLHFKILKISSVTSLHICSLLKVRLLFFLNHEIENKCKRVTGPRKLTNLCCVHIFHTMK